MHLSECNNGNESNDGVTDSEERKAKKIRTGFPLPGSASLKVRVYIQAG